MKTTPVLISKFHGRNTKTKTSLTNFNINIVSRQTSTRLNPITLLGQNIECNLCLKCRADGGRVQQILDRSTAGYLGQTGAIDFAMENVLGGSG